MFDSVQNFKLESWTDYHEFTSYTAVFTHPAGQIEVGLTHTHAYSDFGFRVYRVIGREAASFYFHTHEEAATFAAETLLGLMGN